MKLCVPFIYFFFLNEWLKIRIKASSAGTLQVLILQYEWSQGTDFWTRGPCEAILHFLAHTCSSPAVCSSPGGSKLLMCSIFLVSDIAVVTRVTLQWEEVNVRCSLWGRNQELSASKRFLPFCSREWSVNRFVLDIYLPQLGLNGMSRLSSKEPFSLGCVLPTLVEMIKQDTHLSLWICSPLHYSVLHFYVTSSSLIMVKSFRVDKSWRLQAETRIFQLPLLSSCKHQSEAQCLFCFCYHSCMKKKMYIKGLFADLQ